MYGCRFLNLYLMLFIIIVIVTQDLLLRNMPTLYLIYNQKPMKIKEINACKMILLKRNALK